MFHYVRCPSFTKGVTYFLLLGTLHNRTASDDVDTGLGTGSGHGDTVSDKFINGTAEIYSDVPENGNV